MTMTKEELCKIVTLCWDVASTAPMEGVPPGTIIGSGESELHRIVRMQTYYSLLNHLVPSRGVTSGTLRVEKDKEEWEG